MLETIDNELVTAEGKAGFELADATESCHRKDRGVRIPGRGQVGCAPMLSLQEGPTVGCEYRIGSLEAPTWNMKEGQE